ncbi:hypothetical protein HDE_01989 [Halotydeus destructor]|nr:hypothetical protein HDE_01989 [Halotydeus destructor]
MKTVLVSVMCIFLFSSSLINVAEGHRRFQKGLMLGYILGSQRRGHPAPPHVVKGQGKGQGKGKPKKKVDEDSDGEEEEEKSVAKKGAKASGGHAGTEFVDVDEEAAEEGMLCRDNAELNDCADSCSSLSYCMKENSKQLCETVCRHECYFLDVNSGAQKCMVNLAAAVFEYRDAILKGIIQTN